MPVTLPNANSANNYTAATVDTLTGGAAADTVLLTDATTGAKIDLLAGNDKLTFDDATNSATISNVETIVGGSGDDTLTIATAVSKASINLGDGTD